MKVLLGRLSLAWVATPTTRGWLRVAAVLLLTLVVACESPEEKEARHYERGVELYEEGQDEKAMVEFRNVLRLNPKNADAIFHVGLIHERAKRLKPAFAAFEQATIEQPSFVAAQFKLANTALELANRTLAPGLVDRAAKAADAIEKAEPGNPDGLMMKAAVALVRGETQAALDLAKAALEKAPADEEATAVLAGAYARLGENERALVLLDEAIAAAPASVTLRLGRIALLEGADDVEALAKTYDELIALEPENLDYRLALAKFHREDGDLASAETVLRQAIDSSLLTQETASALVELVYQQHGFEAAEAELVRLIARASDNIDLRFRLAELYAGAERAPDAERTLEAIIKDAETQKTADDARAEIAQLRFGAGDVDGARNVVEDILAGDPDHPKANLIGGAILVREGDFNEAIRSARAALRRDPTWAPGLRLLAEAQLGKGETDAAIDTLGTVVSLDLRDVRSAERLASLLTQRGDSTTALKIWDHVVRITPDSARALQARAAIATAQRNWSEARANIEWLLQLPGQEAAGAMLTGRLFSAQGRFDQAREAFAAAASLRPEAPQPVIELTRAYVKERDLDSAIADLEQRIKNHPDAVAYNLKGGLLARQGKLDEAEAALREAIRLRPEWLIPYMHLASWLMDNGAISEAVDVYQAALEQAQDDATLLYRLGAAYYEGGQADEAIAIFARLVELQPQSDVAVNDYAALIADFAYDDPDRLAVALDLASRFRGSNNANFLDTLGWLHYRNGEFAVATSFLERAISEAPEVPMLHYHLGMVLAQSGQAERAAAELSKAVVDGADYPGIDKARATLAELQKGLPDTALQKTPADRDS